MQARAQKAAAGVIPAETMSIACWKGVIHNPNGATMVTVLGKRGRGKSFAIQYLQFVNRTRYGCVAAMTEVLTTANEYELTIPRALVARRFAPEIIHNTRKFQETAATSIRKYYNETLGMQLTAEELRERYPKHRDWLLIIVDDVCGENPQNLKHEYINGWFTQGRHDQLDGMFGVQYMKHMTPVMRQNSDIIIVAKEDNKMVRQSLYNEYGSSVFATQRLFDEAMNQLTEDRRMIVFDNLTTVASEKIKWFKARKDKMSKFRMGHADFWLMDYMYRRRDTEATYEDMMQNDLLARFCKPSKADDIVLNKAGKICKEADTAGDSVVVPVGGAAKAKQVVRLQRPAGAPKLTMQLEGLTVVHGSVYTTRGSACT